MPISSLLLNFVLLILLGRFLEKRWNIHVAVNWIIQISFTLGIVWLVITSLGYLITPLFFDHGEANIATVSAHWLQGGNIYGDPEDFRRYSLLYGPWPYLVSGALQLLSFDLAIPLSKLAGVMNVMLVVGASFLLSKRASRSDRFLLVTSVCVTLLGYYNISYWNRPDSYLLAYCFLGFALVQSAGRWSDWTVYFGLAVLAGLSSNCKIHGVFYFIPLAVYFIEKNPASWSFAKFAAASAVFFVTFLGPFLLPGVGAEYYLDWLKLASKHGISSWELINNITSISGYFLFLFLMGFYGKYRFTFWCLVVCSLVIAIAGAKPGSGAHHFLPIIPVIIWWGLAEYVLLSQAQRKHAFIIVAALLLTQGHNGIERQKRIFELFLQTPERISQFADLKDIAARYPGTMELGYTDDYESSFYKAWLVIHGRGLLFDGAGVMDLDASGVQIPVSTADQMKGCQISSFVFPNKFEPWSLGSYYEEKETIFSSDFRESFKEHYVLQEKTNFFSIYTCRAIAVSQRR